MLGFGRKYLLLLDLASTFEIDSYIKSIEDHQYQSIGDDDDCDDDNDYNNVYNLAFSLVIYRGPGIHFCLVAI